MQIRYRQQDHCLFWMWSAESAYMIHVGVCLSADIIFSLSLDVANCYCYLACLVSCCLTTSCQISASRGVPHVSTGAGSIWKSAVAEDAGELFVDPATMRTRAVASSDDACEGPGFDQGPSFFHRCSSRPSTLTQYSRSGMKKL